MPTLAIAGGTSPSLGRAIITAVLSSPQTDKWDILVLSRSTKRPLWLLAIEPSNSRVKILTIDYQSPHTLESALQGIDTLISVTHAIDGTQTDIQINLLNAAVRAGCRRFVPSLWSAGKAALEVMTITKQGYERIVEECGKVKGRIECARFNNGTFMNYIGHGIYAIPGKDEDEETKLKKLREGWGYAAGEDEACQGLSREGVLSDGSGGWLIGLKNGIAECPVGSEDAPWPKVTLTQLRDVGRFVAAALELDKWEEEMNIVGDTLDLGELLAHAEAVTGKKFKVVKTTRQELEKKASSLKLPEEFADLVWVGFQIEVTKDVKDSMWLEPVVNRLCPKVKPMGVREYMERHWKAANAVLEA